MTPVEGEGRYLCVEGGVCVGVKGVEGGGVCGC